MKTSVKKFSVLKVVLFLIKTSDVFYGWPLTYVVETSSRNISIQYVVQHSSRIYTYTYYIVYAIQVYSIHLDSRESQRVLCSRCCWNFRQRLGYFALARPVQSLQLPASGIFVLFLMYCCSFRLYGAAAVAVESSMKVSRVKGDSNVEHYIMYPWMDNGHADAAPDMPVKTFPITIQSYKSFAQTQSEIFIRQHKLIIIFKAAKHTQPSRSCFLLLLWGHL